MRTKRNREFTADDLQDKLWKVLQKVEKKQIKPTEANAVTMAAKEICNLERLKLQYMVYSGEKVNRGDLPLLETNPNNRQASKP